MYPIRWTRKEGLMKLLGSLVMMFSFSLTAFASDSFDSSKFNDVKIEYTENGIPIIYDSKATEEIVGARNSIIFTTINNTSLYTTRRLNTVLFIIPAGKVVNVLEIDTNYGFSQDIIRGENGMGILISTEVGGLNTTLIYYIF